MKILLCDDDLTLVEALAHILQLHGHTVTGITSGEEAVEEVKRQEFDWALIDIRMPGMSGIEALKQIKKIDSGLPVSLMTGFAFDDVLAEARQAGADRIFIKPRDIPVLLLSYLATIRARKSP